MYWTQGLHRSLQQHPDAPATIFAGRVRSFRAQADRVSRLAGALRGLGVRDGERVAVCALNSDQYAELQLATPWANGVLVPLDRRWRPGEIADALADSAARILVVDDASASLVPTLGQRCPQVRAVLYVGDGRPPDGMLGFEELIADATPVPDARRGGDALAALIYTGGTTGTAKGVMISHDALYATALANEATAPSAPRPGRILIATPLSHTSGMMTALLHVTYGATLVILPAFDPAAVLAAVEEHRVTRMFLVPSLLAALLDHPTIAERDLSSLQRLLYGAAPISEALLRRAMASLPRASFQQVYAATETATAGTFLTPADHIEGTRLGSAGRPMAHVEIQIVDRADQPVPPGTVGEVVLRGQLMSGYWNRPAETTEALRGGWLHTGDAGYLDEAGYLFLVDRLKDVIVVDGSNVYSAEVENALAGHPAVASSAVIGVPDDRHGERVHAVVVLHPAARTDLAALRAHCRASIADYKLPGSCEYVESIPLSAIGKPLKHELRKPYWAGMERGMN